MGRNGAGEVKLFYAPMFIRPTAPLVALLSAHFVFLVFVFNFAAMPRYLWHLAAAYIFCFAYEYLDRNRTVKPGERVAISLVPMAIANSLFINSEIYAFWSLLVALLLAMLSKSFIHDRKGNHIFNPSIFGITAAAVFFPSATSFSTHTFGMLWPQNFILIAIGLICITVARTWLICMAYQLGFALMAVSTAKVMVSYGIGPEWMSRYSPYAWILPQVSTGVLIFTFGVISDPKTAPRGWRGQLLFGLSIAFFDVLLRSNWIIFSQGLAYLAAQGLWLLHRDFLQSDLKVSDLRALEENRTAKA